MTSASMSPSKSCFFLSANALNSSNSRLSSASLRLESEFLHALAKRVASPLLAEHELVRDNPTSWGRMIS